MSDTDWPSARARIRHAVVELLKARVPAVRRRVYRGRSWPLQERELPALLVYARQEDKKAPAGAGTAVTSYAVELTLAVEIRVAEASRAGEQAEAVEDELEALAGAVTDAVMQAPELLGRTGLIERIEGVRTTFGVHGRDAEQTLGRALVAFDLRFSERYRLLPPPIVCDEPTLTFAPRFDAAP
ncbi:hypothetical protein [Teichococcus aestuarii]|uniref:hypothetical protein n=1 Tax=Teichococcus aestuarii TaxID=568898 RepID=UPI003623D7C0